MYALHYSILEMARISRGSPSSHICLIGRERIVDEASSLGQQHRNMVHCRANVCPYPKPIEDVRWSDVILTACDWHLPLRNICLVRFTLSGFIRYLDPAVVPFEFRLQA